MLRLTLTSFRNRRDVTGNSELESATAGYKQDMGQHEKSEAYGERAAGYSRLNKLNGSLALVEL